MIYTLDTSVIVDALRQPAELDRLKAFLTWEGGWTLVTRDRDFEGLRPLVPGFKFAGPFPERS